jgi:polysaccharide export outer membrane protein
MISVGKAFFRERGCSTEVLMKLTITLLRKSIDYTLSVSTLISLGVRTFPILGSALVLAVVALFCVGVAAQQLPETAAPLSRVAVPSASTVDTRYRIGPGDVLTIIVSKAKELSMEAVRVDQRGMIRIPMIDEPVLAACKTEIELATQIATLYLEYKNNPSVEVFVKDFQSRPVAVMGAVDKPGQFRLQRQVRLLEVLSFAGGPTEKAGRVIDVIHAGGPSICAKGTEGGAGSELEGLAVYKLDETLKGKEGANPFIQPGDVISVPEADQVFVVGYVYQPRSIALKDKPITVTRAIAMAGGPQRDASTSNVRIVRQAREGTAKQEIAVDLKAIMKQKAEDITLLPNDIVEVGSSSGKQILNILTGTLPAVLSQGVIRVIP